MKNLTKQDFEDFNFIPILLRYFALSPENRVTCPGIGKAKITFYQDDNGNFHRIVDLGWDEEDYEPADFYDEIKLETILSIISHLDTLPGTKFGFKTMREQVRALSCAYTICSN